VSGGGAVVADGARSVAVGEVFKTGKAGAAGLSVVFWRTQAAVGTVPGVGARAGATDIFVTSDGVSVIGAIVHCCAFAEAVGEATFVAGSAGGAVEIGIVLSGADTAVRSFPLAGANTCASRVVGANSSNGASVAGAVTFFRALAAAPGSASVTVDTNRAVSVGKNSPRAGVTRGTGPHVLAGADTTTVCITDNLDGVVVAVSCDGAGAVADGEGSDESSSTGSTVF